MSELESAVFAARKLSKSAVQWRRMAAEGTARSHLYRQQAERCQADAWFFLGWARDARYAELRKARRKAA